MKKIVRSALLIAILSVTAAGICRAQAAFLTDANGQVLVENKYVNIQGSPYLDEAWKNGALTTATNRSYDKLKIRFDTYAGELEYLQNGQTYRLNPENVKEFRIADGNELVFRNGFAATGSNTPNTFYQVLVDGPTKLLKQYKVNLMESKAYNSATGNREFQKQDWYFVAKPDGSVQRIQKTKKSVLAAFPEQKDRVEKLMKEKDISLNEESGLSALVTAVNGLQ
ncbi:hypothetical protein [Larkinella soli]|uniref:hypothetical protein n=1 Tax=Larkinella soli TaxID=1770527 RepID=UPI000FFCBE2D|nr:hypothetical protein [Larkinella soli]